jgi:hypothetical protein
VGDGPPQPSGVSAGNRSNQGEKLDELEPTFRRLTAVEWRAADKLAAAMHRDGVDVSSRTAVAEWLERFEALPMAKRNRILGRRE